MVVTIFRSRLSDGPTDEYREMAAKTLELAEHTPGFVSFKAFTAPDGERLSIIEFETMEQVAAWQRHPEHLEAQKAGRERFYSDFSVQVCEEVRAYSSVVSRKLAAERPSR